MEDFVAYFYTKLPRNLMPHIHVNAGVCEKIVRSVYFTDDKLFLTFPFETKILSTLTAHVDYL